MGLLYHLEPSHRSLRLACRTAPHVVLETEVCDSSSPTAVFDVREEGYDQAIDGFGCRPSGARIEQLLSEAHMTFERITDARCNAGIHEYDWPVRDTGAYRDGLRRFWFARKELA